MTDSMKTLDDIKEIYERPCEYCDNRWYCSAGLTAEHCAVDYLDLIKDNLGSMRMFTRVFISLVKLLDEQNSRIYRLEESVKLLKADNRILSEELRKQSLALAERL